MFNEFYWKTKTIFKVKIYIYTGWVRNSLTTVHIQKDFHILNNRTSANTFILFRVFVSLKAAKQAISCFWYQRKSSDQAQLEAQEKGVLATKATSICPRGYHSPVRSILILQLLGSWENGVAWPRDQNHHAAEPNLKPWISCPPRRTLNIKALE